MNYGDKVKQKTTGEVGEIVECSFGYAVAGVNEEGLEWQTVGMSEEEILYFWEVIERKGA